MSNQTAREGADSYLRAVGATALCTAIAFPLQPFLDATILNVTNIAMLYLVGTTVVALRLGRGPAVLTSVTNILALDFFFIPPVFSLEVENTPYLFTLAVMLLVGLSIASLVATIQRQRLAAVTRERRTAALNAMTCELCGAQDLEAMVLAALRHVCDAIPSKVSVLLTDPQGRLSAVECSDPGAADRQSPVESVDFDTAREVAARGEQRIADAIYLPLAGGSGVQGVMVVRPAAPIGDPTLDQMKLLEGFAALLALALQRARIAVAAEQARLSAERALLRNTLLSSISHDLRGPLSAIAGAGSLIAQPETALTAGRRITLGKMIERKAEDMARLLANVLELARMELGDEALHTDWHDIEDLVAHTLRSNEDRLASYRIRVDLPAALPLIMVEATLIVQILGNLLENAVKYTPPGTTIMVSAVVQESHVLLAVADDGPGLPPGDPERLFDKFHRGRSARDKAGVGLGLAICRAAARLHGGEIRAVANPGGGARFEITLPVQQRAVMGVSTDVDYAGAYE